MLLFLISVCFEKLKLNKIKTKLVIQKSKQKPNPYFSNVFPVYFMLLYILECFTTMTSVLYKSSRKSLNFIF